MSVHKCRSIICSLAGSRDRARGSVRPEQCRSIICSLAGSRDRARGSVRPEVGTGLVVQSDRNSVGP